MLTPELIDEGLKLDAARTPGEWEYHSDWAEFGVIGSGVQPATGGPCIMRCDAHWEGTPPSAVDTDYIVASTHPETGWAAALREVERLRAALAELHTDIKSLCKHTCVDREGYSGKNRHVPNCPNYPEVEA